MKKIITVCTSRKTGKEYTFVEFINDGTTAVLVDSEGQNHNYALSTFKRMFRKVDVEIEIEEPKTEEKPMTKHQKQAIQNIRHGYNWVIGGLENSVQDGQLDALPSIEDMFNEVYDEVMSCFFDIGFCDSKGAPVCMKFAGKTFVREQIAKLFREDGYEVSDELIAVPAKKQRHSNFVDGERVNLRNDEAEKTVKVLAFTGMLIGTFEVKKETETYLAVKAAKGWLKFDKTTGVQLNAANPKYANRIEL